MKTCPVCGASYTARISFCFEDGAVLVASGASAGDTPAARVSNRVPSRVATPVSPGRRGRSLLSRQSGGLTFSPPRPTPASPPRRAAEDLTPAPLEPLELPEDLDTDGFGMPLPHSDVSNITPGAPPQRHKVAPDTPAPPHSPTPAQPRRKGPDEAELTYDDLDFPSVAAEVNFGEDDVLETFDDYEYEEQRPAWLIPALLVGGAVVLLMGLVFGLGLAGTAALVGGGSGDSVVAVPAPVPEAAPEPAVVDAQPQPVAPEPVVAPDPEPTIADAAPLPAPAPVAAPAPAPAPAPTVAPAPAPAVAPAPAPEASVWGTVDSAASTVEVTTNPPGAEVWLDGNPIGVTPFTHPVDFGAYTLEIRLEGYETLYDDLMVNTQKTRKSYELRGLSRSGAVIVVFEGWDGAILTVDGRRAGALPARLTLTEGSHDFAVENSAGETMQVTREVELSDGGVTIVNLSS